MAGAKWYEEEAQALNDFLKCLFGITVLAALRCAIDLRIPDIVANHPGGVTLAELSSELGCSLSYLHRLMRVMTHHRIFKEVKRDGQDSPIAYAQTAFSRLLMENSMAPFCDVLCSPEIISSIFSLGTFLVSKNCDGGAFETVHGVNLWQYIMGNPSLREVFNKGMSSHAQSTISKVIENCMATFEDIGCLVDVGGGDGTALRAVVKACPWIIRAVNFDLPHVVSSLNDDSRVEHVGGDMFVTIPTADAALIMSVLHDWDDDACVKILKNCKQAIPKETGKVIIVDIIVDDENLSDGNSKYRDVQLGMDLLMMALTNKGKERTSKEWAKLLTSAGFTKYTIKHISAPQSVIEAYP